MDETSKAQGRSILERLRRALTWKARCGLFLAFLGIVLVCGGLGPAVLYSMPFVCLCSLGIRADNGVRGLFVAAWVLYLIAVARLMADSRNHIQRVKPFPAVNGGLIDRSSR